MRFISCIIFLIFQFSLSGQIYPSKPIELKDSISIVQIIGLNRTKPRTIYREINFAPNNKLHVNDSLLTRWELRLSSLGLFNEVECKFQNDTLKIRVVEEFYYWLYPTGGFADRNFYNWAKHKDLNRIYFGGEFSFFNLYGLNHTLSLTLVGGYNQIYGLSYEFPSTKFSNGWGGKLKTSYSQSHEIWLLTNNDRIQFFDVDEDYAQRITNFEVSGFRKINYQAFIELGYNLTYYEISKTASIINPLFFVNGNKQLSQTGYINFVYDTRDQRHYPTQGTELKINYSLINQGYDNFNWVQSFNFKSRKFFKIDDHHHIATLFNLNYKLGVLTYLNQRQLGYNSDYVRGYESYVIDGRGSFLAKIAFRKALYLGKIDLQKMQITKKYNKMPLSLWASLYSDLGKIINPNPIQNLGNNTLNFQYLRSVGIGFDVLCYYDILTRFDLSKNNLGNWVFNISFRHAI